MKKLFLTGLISLTSFSVFAFHPGPTDPVVQIGFGTQLVFKKDMNIKPLARHPQLGKISENNVSCYIGLRQSEAYDRVIKAGVVLTITGFGFYNYEGNNTFTVDHPGIRNIECYGDKEITIGQFSNSISEYINIKLALPKDL